MIFIKTGKFVGFNKIGFNKIGNVKLNCAAKSV